jgi:hypothetical protein
MMTNPPYEGDERDADTGAQSAEPDRNLTQPVQPFDRPAPPLVRPYGQPGPARPRPYPVPGGPQGYGPPRYAQPTQPDHGQPGRSRVGLIAAVTGIGLLLVFGIVVLVLTLQSTVLDPAAVERDVSAQFEEREGVPVDLSCAEEMQVDEGDSYRCTGVTADGEEVTLRITITDEESAAYTWTEP